MMKTRMKTVITAIMLVLLIVLIVSRINMKTRVKTDREDLNVRRFNLKTAGSWKNFTYIHITGMNWTIANETEWCSGTGSWDDPYLIENMIINASASPIGCGILIEDSTNVYFKISNITIFETTNGIKFENTNKGTIFSNTLVNNLDSGISLVNSINNTISGNNVINNGMNGIHLYSNCNDNRIVGNLAENDGTNLQDTGIHLENLCSDNEILENFVHENNLNGIFLEDLCESNFIFNNTIKNTILNQQNYGLYLDNDCHQNNISSNIIESITNYGIMLVTSDQNFVSNNQIIDVNYGFYMLIAHQSTIIGNTISGGSVAILMSACDGGKIIRNFMNGTGSHAIRVIINCDNNEFHDNIIKDNNVGIQLDDPSDINNEFYRNSFISNDLHAYDNGTATAWNNTIGNYWDNYTGMDLNLDNIGDTPYSISGAANASDSLPIVDHWPPIIIINAPSSSYYRLDAPEFNVLINETYIYSTWYTINSDHKKYYFTENGTIEEDAWTELDDGNIIITFYARDIAWKTDSAFVNVYKDTVMPSINITSPLDGQSFSHEAPSFTVEISDINLDKMWYTLSGDLNKYFFLENGTLEGWIGLTDGQITITFHANDTAGNSYSTFVNLYKSTSQVPNNGPLPFEVIIIIIIIALISAIIIAGIVVGGKIIKRKRKISIKLTEEQVSEAQYFKDVTSILTILAIHKESGLCLSKIALHEGSGLDEHLFTGFISAMGSFKNELAKQMGLPVQGEGGDNTIMYNEFTITLMDGEYLRLGLVSHASLGDLIKVKCGQVLRDYELAHVSELKEFDGDIQIFKDFEETFESGLDMNLNKKCMINVKQLNKYDAHDSFANFLKELNSRTDGFYPAEIAVNLAQELYISNQEANFMVYKAFRNQLFLPIN